ncbi:cytochrome P450 6g1-like, partial [Teleopsis dalmanni]|uniref:cytochrome P450 6g1-like n=1 Tax=Teleopsis dalmanni TaxID=139649 RepID=UPI0018CE870A
MALLSQLFSTNLFSHLTEVLAVSVVFLSIVWLWLQHHYSYWKRQNVPYIKPLPLFGNFKNVITWDVDICAHFQNLYNHKNAIDQPVVGLFMFNKPCLLVRDLEIVKSVLIKDFNKFSNRFAASDPHSDSLGANNLFFAKNPKWKEIRVKLTPVFTSGKMKQMFPLVEEVGRELDKYLSSLPIDPETNAIMKEVKDLNTLFTTDVIATVAYGIRANSMINPDGDFRTNGKRIFEFTRRRAFEFTAMFFMPSIVKLFGFKVFSKDTTNFLRETINYVISERIKSGTTRNDLIDILVNFRKEAEASKDKNHFILEGDCLVAQAAIFFSAGFETSSSAMSFSLYELARHPKLQERLREEIREAFQSNNGVITYDIIKDMK